MLHGHPGSEALLSGATRVARIMSLPTDALLETNREGAGPRARPVSARLVAFTLGCMAWGGDPVAPPVPGASASHPARVRPASDCPDLFGDGASQIANRARRKTALIWAFPDRRSIDLVHTTDWQEPVVAWFRGVALRGVEDAGGGRLRALLSLDGSDRTSCAPGTYAVGIDHEIGPGAPVLAITPGVILLERKGKLRYLRLADARPPIFRMSWVSSWNIPKRSVSSAIPPTATIRPAAPPPRPQPPARPAPSRR